MPSLTITTRLVRRPRGKCASCHRRRVLLSLVAEGDTATGESARLCHECAGVGRVGDLPW